MKPLVSFFIVFPENDSYRIRFLLKNPKTIGNNKLKRIFHQESERAGLSLVIFAYYLGFHIIIIFKILELLENEF
jgi:hypothetical protein